MEKNEVNTMILAAKSSSPPMIWAIEKLETAAGEAKTAVKVANSMPRKPNQTARLSITPGTKINLVNTVMNNCFQCWRILLIWKEAPNTSKENPVATSANGVMVFITISGTGISHNTNK